MLCGYANTTSIFKKVQKDDSGGYRLVSLTSIHRKVMEHRNNFQDNKIIGDNQHRYKEIHI